MHEKIQDVMNTAWENYKNYWKSGDMQRWNKSMGALTRKYQGEPLIQQFAENIAISYGWIINAMAEEKRNEQQVSEKEKK